MGNGVILDTNCFSHVFSSTDSRHEDYIVFFDWLFKGNGVLVYGGTKYLEELKKTRYRKIFYYLNSNNKARIYDKEAIDKEEKRIKALVPSIHFNDHHLPAISIISGSGVICTNDTECIKFIKSPQIYSNGRSCPKFYVNDKNKALLSSKYVGKGCRLSKKMLESVINHLNDIIS